MPELHYLTGYPESLLQQVRRLIEQDKLGQWLDSRYPEAHDIKTDKALYAYTQALKQRYLRSSAPLSKVGYENRLNLVQNALGLHTAIARVQGHRLKAKAEIQIAALFREAPAPFLRMIVVHELAHLREKAHNKAFYQLCQHMEPDYHQLEFDLRLYLTHQELAGAR